MLEYVIENAKVERTSTGSYVVVADSERFGEQEVMFEGCTMSECEKYIEEHTKSSRTLENSIKEIVEGLPEEKKKVLVKALERNFCLTSSYVLASVLVKVYEEGMYFEFEGTRSGYKVFVNKDGKVMRKPNENKLNKIDCFDVSLSESVFERI